MNSFFQMTQTMIRYRAFFLRRKFEKSLLYPEDAQAQVLREILKVSGKSCLPEAPTEFSDYPANTSWSLESPEFFETTSGSSGIKKPIPYTKSLLKSFENMFLIWADDVLRTSSFSTGRTFISFSPNLTKLGMQSDGEYLSLSLQMVLNRYLVAKPEDFIAYSGEDFLYNLAIQLIQDRTLEIISIWSPSYFLSILECIQGLDLAAMPDLKQAVDHQDWQRVWPNLKFISCWADGSSSSSFEKLKTRFPFVKFQPKGLLATEAPMTIPWAAAGDSTLPLWTEVYLEFIDDKGSIRHLTEMKPGEVGEILISTRGGLLRYRLGDLVECTGRYMSSPKIRFLSRKGETSDLVGEKLSSQLVKQAFCMEDLGYWTMMANQDHYVFISDKKVDPEIVRKNLEQIFHFGLARELNQLKETQIWYVPKLQQKYFQYFESKGIKKGDIKDRLLWSDSGFLNFLSTEVSLEPSRPETSLQS